MNLSKKRHEIRIWLTPILGGGSHSQGGRRPRMELYFEGEGTLGKMWGRMKRSAAKCMNK